MDTVGLVTGESSDVPVRLAVVDDDPMVRAALGMMLGGDSGITVVAEAGDGEEALRVVPAADVDVVLMDIRMPVRDGLSATEALLETDPDLKVIVLTTFDTDDMVLQVDQALLGENRARRGDLIVIVAGSPPGIAGSTNALRVHRVGDAVDRLAE